MKYYVEFPIKLDCGLNCFYCFNKDRFSPDYINNLKIVPDAEGRGFTLDQWNLFRETHLSDASEIIVYLCGGEPFFGDNKGLVVEFLERTSMEKVELQTAGLQSPDDYAILEPFKSRMHRIGLTFHRKVIGGDGALVDKFEKTVMMLKGRGFNVYVKELLFSDEKQNILRNKKKWMEAGVPFKIQDYKGDFGGRGHKESYINSDFGLIDDEFLKKGLFCSCKKGYKSFIVRGHRAVSCMYSGDIIACWHDYKVIGNIQRNEFVKDYRVYMKGKKPYEVMLVGGPSLRKPEVAKMKGAMTVSGPMRADKLGHILPHEHIIMKFPDFQTEHPLYPEIAGERVSAGILGKIRRHVWSCRDNCRLDEKDVAVDDLLSFKANGGGTIVDVTTLGLGRDVAAVKEIAERAGVNVIVGTGYYIGGTHPDMRRLSAQEIEGWMFKEISEGINGTGVKAGVIGEIGTSSVVTPDEEKVLRAGLRVHRRTGAPVSIHQYGGIKRVHAIIREEGVDPRNVILCHMCMCCSEDERIWAADQGYYVELDGFGNEFYLDHMTGRIVHDSDRMEMVRKFVDRGFLKQLLVSQDTAFKIMLKKYGGWGYEHIITNIRPFMLRGGFDPRHVNAIIYENPAEVFGYLGYDEPVLR